MASEPQDLFGAENITPTPQTPSPNNTPGDFPRDSPEDLDVIYL